MLHHIDLMLLAMAVDHAYVRPDPAFRARLETSAFAHRLNGLARQSTWLKASSSAGSSGSIGVQEGVIAS